MSTRILALLTLTSPALFGCSSFSSEGPTRADVITELVEDVMLPAHEELAMRAAALTEAATFCAEGSTVTLADAQATWRAAHQAMGATGAFDFGPVVDDRHDAALLFWPTRPELFEVVVEDAAPIDATAFGGLGAAAKGLPAIEAQWFDPAGDDAVLADFAEATGGPRRCDLLALLAADVAAHAEALERAWSPTGGDYGGELARAGTEGSRYLRVQASLDEILNGVIAQLQIIDDVELAKPLGAKTGGVPQPELVPSPYADDSVAMIRAQLGGVDAVWHGRGRGGLRTLVRGRSPALVPMVDDALVAADTAVAGIAGPLRVAVVDDPAAVQTAIDRIKDLRRLFTVDVVQHLDGTVTLSDNDGD